MSDLAICWFKRDLRITDHAALQLAARHGRVLPLYILEPSLWQGNDASGRQYGFLLECLKDLRQDLAGVGAELTIRVGDAVEILEDLRRKHRVTHLLSHEETGNQWTFERDLRVADWAKGQGVQWTELPQSAVVRRLKTRDTWQSRRDKFVRQMTIAAPTALAGPNEPSDEVPQAAALGLRDHCPERQSGGRQAALKTIHSFLMERGRNYRTAMSSPLEGAQACSRISPHLAFGTLSVREATQAGLRRSSEVKGARDGWSGSMKSFQSRLAWRDHFIQKLEDQPDLENRCLHPAYEALRPTEPDKARLEAWSTGTTGLPFFDACMRSLSATGWLNFRMRSMVMAVASYHLWLDWRATGPVLARLFTDYEPGIHWSQVQMQSGTTGMNAIRIYNPVKQGYDQDPTGAFTRHWLPELRDLPDAHLQEPWTWGRADEILDKIYPAPIVDVAKAARKARERVWAVRKEAGFRDEAARLVTKHGSRKRRRPGIPKPDRQMSFDL
ncbi:FAD-binding domain-containing protein [uncultured Roseovarius sp.]|uniref:FAD-binding domain-containing protein n=1 Tax=uncultured Roseovarius sp. TaxID=293344 RepID=UPI0025E91A4B|nr:FAD-binding domain-containing protein [uncultured Roseovarius sp.]